MITLGVNGWHTLSHDAAACLLVDGELVGAIEEERILRRKHAWDLPPIQATQVLLREAGLGPEDVDEVAFGWDLSRTHALDLPDERMLEVLLPPALVGRAGGPPPLVRVPHHIAHAHYAYHSSPAAGGRAAVVVVDGAGEREATSIGSADEDGVKLDRAYGLEQSLGQLYSAACRFLGYSDLDGGKLMALAALGRREPTPLDRVELREFEFIGLPEVSAPSAAEHDVCDATIDAWHATFRDWFGLERLPATHAFSHHLRFEPDRHRPIPAGHIELATAVQGALERVLTGLVAAVRARYETDQVALGGGVALNCAANGVLERELGGGVHVPPAPGDAGVAVGAALAAQATSRRIDRSSVASPFLGPELSLETIRSALDGFGLRYELVDDPAATAAELLLTDRLVGWFQGRMEFGPRALGHRSILANPAGADVRARINELKGREPWRPVGISLLDEAREEVLAEACDSPYMMKAARVRPDVIAVCPDIVHVDGTTRPQLVTAQSAPAIHGVIEAFRARAGWPMVINTSFNRRDEPIVYSPEDAVRTFFTTPLHALLVGPCLLTKP